MTEKTPTDMDENRPTLEGNVNFQISEGPFTASWEELDAEIRTHIQDFGFGDKNGSVRLNYGGSIDSVFGTETGLEIRIDKKDFVVLALEAANKWEDFDCTLHSEMGDDGNE